MQQCEFRRLGGQGLQSRAMLGSCHQALMHAQASDRGILQWPHSDYTLATKTTGRPLLGRRERGKWGFRAQRQLRHACGAIKRCNTPSCVLSIIPLSEPWPQATCPGVHRRGCRWWRH